MTNGKHTRTSVLQMQQAERRRRKIVAFLATIAALMTFGALMLPAISMTHETAPMFGVEEQQSTDAQDDAATAGAEPDGQQAAAGDESAGAPGASDAASESASSATGAANEQPAGQVASAGTVRSEAKSAAPAAGSDASATASGSASSSANSTPAEAALVAKATKKAASRRGATGQTNQTDDLNNLIADVDIKQATTGDSVITDDGKVIAKNDTQYDFTFVFKETEAEGDKDGWQLSNSEDLYYTLPDGVVLPEGSRGEFSISIANRVISGNTYEVVKDADGKLKLKIKLNKHHRNFRFLQNSKDVEFKLNIRGTISETVESLTFDYQDKLKYEVEHQTSHNASVQKTGSYNASDGKMHYKVIIHSEDGASKDVRVVDGISGTALGNATITGVYVSNADGSVRGANAAYTDNGAASGFDITIGTVAEDQYVVVEYTADVDYSKIANSGKATFAETGNTVRIDVPGDDDTTDNEARHEEPGVVFSSIQKVATSTSDVVEDNGRKYRIVTWKVTANPEGIVSLKGSNITDTLHNNNEVEYYGTGLTVTKTLGDTTTTENPTWAQVGVNSLASDGGWRYAVTDDGNWSYEITYKTRVDVTDLASDKTLEVKNTAKDKYDEDTGTVTVRPDVTVEPDKVVPVVSKNATSVTEETTTWKISVEIPAGWSGPLVVEDVIPSSNNEYWDSFVSATVDGYTQGSDYTLTVNREQATVWSGSTSTTTTVDKSFKLDFGTIAAAGQNRTINITVVTGNNADWMATGDAWRDSHTNTARATDGTTPYSEDHDDAQPKPRTLAKTFAQAGEYSYCEGRDAYGNPVVEEKLPVFAFDLALTGVTADNVQIDEIFDTDLFEVYQGNEYITYEYNDYLDVYYGTNTWSRQGPSATKATAAPTATGATLTLTNLPRTEGNAFYGFYWVRYYLAVKPGKLDEFKQYVIDHGTALEKNGNATGKTCLFDNTADWDGVPSTAQFNYDIDKIFNKAGTDNDDGTYSYTITLNPDKLKINGGTNIDMQDVFSGAKVTADSVLIVAENAAGETVPYKMYASDEAAAQDEFDGIVVIYDESSDTVLTVEIPDETSVRMTYTASSTGEAQVNVESGKAVETVANTASALDYHYTVTFTHEYDFIGKQKSKNDDGTVTFTIDFNAEKLTLKGGNDITLTDTYTGDLTIDDTSFAVTACDPDSDGTKAAAVLASMLKTGSCYAFTVPDATHVTITYTGTPQLNTNANGTITANYSNKAEAEGVPVTVEGEVDSFVLKKTADDLITTAAEGDEDTIGSIPFTIEFNPLRQTLNNGKPLELTDRFSGLLVEYSTVRTYMNGELTTDLDYDFSGYVGTFTVPDASYIKITYLARPDFSKGSEVEWSNVVEAHGYTSETGGTADQSSSGEGTGSQGNEVWLYKYESGHMNRPVDNVTFKLYYDNEGTMEPVKNDDGDDVFFKTQNDATKGHGYVYVALTEENGFTHRTLEQDQIYYLLEVPDENTADYYPNTTAYNFVIHDDLVKDSEGNWVENEPYVKPDYMKGTTVYLFGKGDIVKVANDKITDSVTAQKYWVNADGTWTWPADITTVTFKLRKQRAAGTLVDLTGANTPSYYVDNDDETVTFSDTLNATTDMPRVTWEHLDALGEGERYVVTETHVDGQPVVDGRVTVRGRTYNVNGGTVTNGKTYVTNSEITDIAFEKKWDLPSDTITFTLPDGMAVATDHAEGNQVTLSKNELIVKARLHRWGYAGGDKLDTYDFDADDAAYNVSLTGGAWTATWSDLPTAGVDVKGNEVDFVYEVVEEKVTVPTTVMNDGSGGEVDLRSLFTATSKREGNKLAITNALANDDNYYLNVRKEWLDSDGKVTTGEAVEFQLLRDSVATTVEEGAVGSGVQSRAEINEAWGQSGLLSITPNNGVLPDSLGVAVGKKLVVSVTPKSGTPGSYPSSLGVYKLHEIDNSGWADYAADVTGVRDGSSVVFSVPVTADLNSLGGGFKVSLNVPHHDAGWDVNITVTGPDPVTTTEETTGEVLKPAASGAGYEVDASGNYKFTVAPDQTVKFASLPHTVEAGSTTTTYTYRVVETSTGTGWHVVTGAGSYDPAPLAGEERGHTGDVVLVNRYDEPQTTSFAFTKVWHDLLGEVERDWQSDITVSLYTQKGKVGDFTLGAGGLAGGDYTWTSTANVDGTFTFHIEGLPAKDGSDTLVYYVQEAQVSGFGAPVYAYKQAGEIVGKSDSSPTKGCALNGEYIINTPQDSYALPTTGGPGTGAPYALGLLLLLAGAALLFRSAGKTRRVLL